MPQAVDLTARSASSTSQASSVHGPHIQAPNRCVAQSPALRSDFPSRSVSSSGQQDKSIGPARKVAAPRSRRTRFTKEQRTKLRELFDKSPRVSLCERWIFNMI